MSAPGRNCPLSYRYAPEAFAREPQLAVDTLWVAGGLYGNPFALDCLLERFQGERGAKALVLNGDFHWFDIDAGDFSRINRSVLGHRATRGNVETELAAPAADAGCGCAYPDWVDDGTVERSNAIMEGLRGVAGGLEIEQLAALPMHLVAQVGDSRVGVAHGDADSLAGWGFSHEVLCTPQGAAAARRAFARANVQVFASSHTCLPVLARFGASQVLANNGAAGMPNFDGERYGIATRISVFQSEHSLYAAKCGQLFIEAVPLRYDHAAWQKRFLELWPPGSAAHVSYYRRIIHGPSYVARQALREELFSGERQGPEQHERAEHARR